MFFLIDDYPFSPGPFSLYMDPEPWRVTRLLGFYMATDRVVYCGY